MARSKLFAAVRWLTLAASVGAPGLAAAADLLPPPPPPPPPPPVEFGGGWYLRGDIGASIYDRPKYVVHDTVGTTFYGGAQSGGFFAGAGVGYQFNSFLRADVTGEYRSVGLRTNSYNDFSYSGCDYDGGPCYTAQGRNNNISQGHLDAAVVLANVYVDLGTYYGVTPFLGAGVGVSFNHFNGWSDTGGSKTVVSYDDYGSYTQGGSSAGAFRSKSTESLAWALHAGLAYDVTPNFKVELAYRYLNMGHASTGVLNCFCGDTLVPLKAKSLEAHDIKIGLRYYLGGFAAAPLPPLTAYEPAPGPLVRKY